MTRQFLAVPWARTDRRRWRRRRPARDHRQRTSETSARCEKRSLAGGGPADAWAASGFPGLTPPPPGPSTEWESAHGDTNDPVAPIQIGAPTKRRKRKGALRRQPPRRTSPLHRASANDNAPRADQKGVTRGAPSSLIARRHCRSQTDKSGIRERESNRNAPRHKATSWVACSRSEVSLLN